MMLTVMLVLLVLLLMMMMTMMMMLLQAVAVAIESRQLFPRPQRERQPGVRAASAPEITRGGG